jgi:hypothetical protein
MTNGNSAEREAAFDDLIDAYQQAQRGTLKERAEARRELKQAYRAALSVCANGVELRDFQRELANYFEDVGDPHGAIMIRNFADLSRADGGKDSSGAEPVEESDVRPKERLCGGSHVACNGVDYCLGHPSCRDIANERAKKEQK